MVPPGTPCQPKPNIARLGVQVFDYVGGDAFGMVKQGDTLTLLKVQNVSAPDEKPWYEVEWVYDLWVRKR